MKIKYTISSLLILLFFSYSCTDRLADINEDPNRQDAATANPGFLFAQGVHLPILKENFSQQIGNIADIGPFARYFTNLAPNAFQADSYINANVYTTFGFWTSYWKAMPLLNQALQSTDVDAEFDNLNNNAMIRIWRVYVLSRLTDIYGDIPFDEAGNGVEGDIAPTYQGQEAVYDKFFLELDRALKDLTTRKVGVFTTSDILYEGDIEKWRKFGNALRLRLAMRIRYADAAKSQAEALKAFNGGLLTSNEDNALVETSTVQNNFQHPIYQVSTSQAGQVFKLSASFVDFLKGSNTYLDGGNTSGIDPRLDILVADNNFGGKEGVANGYTAQFHATNPQFFALGSFVEYHNKPTTPVTIMSYAEVQFLLAEAVLADYNGISGSASDYYKNGISASITDLQGTVGNFADNETILFNATTTEEDKLERIIYQKWIAVFPDTHEAWAEQRRTGFPVVAKRTGGDFSLGTTNGTIPNRIPYPQLEVNTNATNVNSAISNQGGDDLLNKLWWDKRTTQDAWEY